MRREPEIECEGTTATVGATVDATGVASGLTVPEADAPIVPAAPEGSLTVRASWLMAAKTVAFALATILPLLLVRRLSQIEVGNYKQVFLVANTLVTVLPFGFSMSAFYFLPRERERQGAVVLNVLLVYVLLGAVSMATLFLFPSLLGRLFNDPLISEYSPQIAVLVFVWLIAQILEVLPVAHQELRVAAVLIVASQLSKTFLLVGVALISPSVVMLIYAVSAHCIVQSIVLFVYMRKRFPRFLTSFDFSFLKTQLAYALPYGLNGVMFSMQLDLHNYFVSNRFGAASFAIYSIGCFQLPLVSILSESLGGVLIPRICLLEKEGRHREVIEVTASVMRKLAAIYFPLFAFFLVVGREFITVLFTEKFLPSWPIFAIYLILLPFNILVLDAIQRAYADLKYFFVNVRIASLVLMAVGLYFVDGPHGLVEAISVVVAVNVLQRMVTAVKLASVLGVGRRDLVYLKDIGKIAAASLVAGVAGEIVREALGAKPIVVLVVCSAVFGVAYAAAILASGVPTSSERLLVRAQVARFQRLFTSAGAESRS